MPGRSVVSLRSLHVLFPGAIVDRDAEPQSKLPHPAFALTFLLGVVRVSSKVRDRKHPNRSAGWHEELFSKTAGRPNSAACRQRLPEPQREVRPNGRSWRGYPITDRDQ